MFDGVPLKKIIKKKMLLFKLNVNINILFTDMSVSVCGKVNTVTSDERDKELEYLLSA